MASPLEQLRSQYPNLSDDAIAELANVTLKVSGSKKTRKGFLGLIKEVAPETPIPEIENESAMAAELAKRDEQIALLRKEREDDKFSASLASQKNEARAKFGLSDDDFSKMEEMMKKGELPADYKFAPALYKQQTDIATPTSYGSSGYGPVDLQGALQDEGFKGLVDDPDTWAQKTAHSMIDGFRKRNATAF